MSIGLALLGVRFHVLELLARGQGVEPWVPHGKVSWVPLDGHQVMAEIVRSASETRRRKHVGLRAVLDRRVLRVLASLPWGVAVPVDWLDVSDRKLLRRLPRSVVDWSDSSVQVLLRPAVELLSVGVVARSWQDGLKRSAAFAPYCARYVVLTECRRRQDLSWAQSQARFYGVGLAVCRDDELDWRVAPAPFRADRFTAASWLMAERVTEALAG